jgi:hypothetical protein
MRCEAADAIDAALLEHDHLGPGAHQPVGQHDVAEAEQAQQGATVSGKKLQTLVAVRGSNARVTKVALSGDAKHLVIGPANDPVPEDITASLWEAASGKKLHTFRGHTGLITSVALRADGKQPWTAS